MRREWVPGVETVIPRGSRPMRACRLDLQQYDERPTQYSAPGPWGTLAITACQPGNRRGGDQTHRGTIYKPGRVFLGPIEDKESNFIRSKFCLRAALQSSIISFHNEAEPKSIQGQFNLFQELEHCIRFCLPLKQPDLIEKKTFTRELWLNFRAQVARRDTYYFAPKLARERTIVSASTA